MKKILLISLLFISVSILQAQEYSFTWLRVQDITNTRHFIHQGDTIDFDAFSDAVDSVDVEDNFIKFYANGEILDSAYWDYYQQVDTFRIIGDSIQIKLTEDTSNYINISSLTSKLDTVAIDTTLTGDGTSESPLGINETVLANTMKTIYTITLPSAATVAGRCSGAVEGTDYPTGWSISAGANAADLKITHGLERRVVYVSVWSVDGVEERQLFGNAAYAGILAETDEILLIESLATIQADIVIQIVFAP